MANPTDSRSHILVVDDDQRLLELLKKFLEELYQRLAIYSASTDYFSQRIYNIWLS
jgi:DNA-binding response OmpR family regulator